MLQLNFHLRRGEPSPYKIAALIRSSGHSLKSAIRYIIQCVKRRRAADTEVGMDEEKTTETALDEYRQTLKNTFGSSERIYDVVRELKWWIDGT